jgi:DNA-binding winged helix-turn-helix (wHTH) protein/Tol biopolymer transport system component
MTAPAAPTSRRYRFADLALDVGQRRVRRGSEIIPLSKLSFDLLRVLADNAPNVVPHEQLASQAWGPRRIVTPENLAKRVMLLRQALGDHADDSRYIEGVRGHGYRLIPDVHEDDALVSGNGIAANRTVIFNPTPPAEARDPAAAFAAGYAAGDAAPAPPVRRVLTRRRVLVGAAAAAVAAIAVDDYRLRRVRRRTELRLAGAERPHTFELRAPRGSSFGESPTSPQPALAPGGRELAFIAPIDSTDMVWVQALGQLDARPLRGTEKAAWPFWSADGRSVAFYADGGLERAAADGGAAPTEIARFGGAYWGGAWAADGTVLYGGTAGLYRVAEGGAPEPWTELDASRGEYSHRFPVLLPDGRRFVYLALSTQPEREGYYVGSLDERGMKRWLRPGHAKAAVDSRADGRVHLIFVGADGELLAQAFDPTQTKLIGDAVEVAPAETAEINGGARAGALAAGDRVLVYRPRMSALTRLVWRDRAGTLDETIDLPDGAYRHLALSHDATMLTVEREGHDEASGLWLIDRRRMQNRRLGEGNVSAWTKDDSGVVYSSVRADGWNVDMRTVAGGAEPKTLVAGGPPFVKRIRDVTLDGLVFQCELAGQSSLWYAPFNGAEPPRMLPVAPEYATHARVSPDGRWLAYAATEAGETHVYVARFEDLGGTVRVSTSEGTDPQWRSDGRELYYVTRDRTLMAVSVTAGEAFESSTPAPLFHVPFDPRSVALGSAYAPAPDGLRFMVVEVVDQEEPRLLVTLNWP